MTHDREGGGEKRHLGALTPVGVRADGGGLVQARDAAIESVTDGGAHQGAEGTAKDEADAAA
jgi:hypothetical protein